MVSALTLPEERFLAQFDLREVSALVRQGRIQAARSALLAHYERQVARWPALPRTYSSALYTLSREELVTRAEAILAHRFTLEGWPEVELGRRVDWRYNPTPDPRARWTRELNRHTWWVLLALAYAQTGDERFARAFVAFMRDWVAKNPPPEQKDEEDPVWTLMGVGMRCVNWTIAFGTFYRSPAFTEEAKLTMLRSIYDHARFLYLFQTSRNHLLRESNGLAHISLYFPEFKEARLWRQAALARLDEALTKQVNQDGSHIEMSTGYQWLVVDEFQRTHDLLRLHQIPFPRLTRRLERMYHLLAYLIRPDGTYPQLNDGFLDSREVLLARLRQAGERFGRGDFVYIGTQGKQGTLPKEASVEFPDAGLYVMRSDWTPEARYLLFDAGPYGGPHGHEDKLSIEVFAYGTPFIVDTGVYTYNDTDPFRLYFVGSQGHNTVLVDGQSQVRRWRAESLRPRPAPGPYATWVSRPAFDYVVATYRDGYAPFRLTRPKEASPVEDVVHTRHILFVKPDYWVVVDELQAAGPHRYQVLFHAAPHIRVRCGPDGRVILSPPSGTPALYLIPAEPHAVTVGQQAGSEEPIQGWYSDRRHHKVPATTVIYEREGRASTTIATLLYPCRDGTGEGVTLEPLSGEGGLAFVVTTARGRDYLFLSREAGVRQVGPYKVEGMVAGVRTDGKGKVLTRFSWEAR